MMFIAKYINQVHHFLFLKKAIPISKQPIAIDCLRPLKANSKIKKVYMKNGIKDGYGVFLYAKIAVPINTGALQRPKNATQGKCNLAHTN